MRMRPCVHASGGYYKMWATLNNHERIGMGYMNLIEYNGYPRDLDVQQKDRYKEVKFYGRFCTDFANGLFWLNNHRFFFCCV